jgi:hypothetical protein
MAAVCCTARFICCARCPGHVGVRWPAVAAVSSAAVWFVHYKQGYGYALLCLSGSSTANMYLTWTAVQGSPVACLRSTYWRAALDLELQHTAGSSFCSTQLHCHMTIGICVQLGLV